MEKPGNDGAMLPAPRGTVTFTYNEASFRALADERLVNLTEMWKAAGSPANQSPYQWSRTEQGKGFIDATAANLNRAKNLIWKSKRGKHLGGTWAHWQVALAYAKYLSHEFHIFANEAFRQWAEERADPDLKAERAIEGYRRGGHDDRWIAERLEGKLVRTGSFTPTLQEHGVRDRGFADATDAINVKVLGGTAREFRESKGLPATARTRDHMDVTQLGAIKLGETLATEAIKGEGAFGNGECVSVCVRAGNAVKLALEHMQQTKRS